MEFAHLTYMANQIARNFEIQGMEEAAASTARHIADFWDPRMIAQIRASDRAALSAIARDAVARLDHADR